MALHKWLNLKQRENILDTFLANRLSLENDCDTIAGISDHEAILVQSLSMANLKLSQCNIHICMV